MEEERRTPKNKNMRRMFWDKIAGKNVSRCFLTSLILAITTAVLVILINIFFLNERTVGFVLPGVFFAIGCAGFAVLCYSTRMLEAKEYYDFVSFGFTFFIFGYLCFISSMSATTGGTIVFYYIGVLLASYVIVTTTKQYVIFTAVETAGFIALAYYLKAKGVSLDFMQYVYFALTHAFAAFLSRENYNMRAELTRQEFRTQRETNKAEKDALTGLINRRGLERETKQIFKLCVRQQDTVCVTIIDIDKFKVYNDTFGHPKGDWCLQTVAKCIADTVGDKGYASRIGGEEFLVFLYGMEEHEMFEIAESVRQNVENMRLPHATAKDAVVTISLGCFIGVPTEQTSFTSMYGMADKLLYKAKETGRNRVICNKKYHIRQTRAAE